MPVEQIHSGFGGMCPHGPIFHWKEGWYFCRGEALDVHIWNVTQDIDLRIPRAEWDSIVAALKE